MQPISFFLNLLGIFLFLFLFWRRLKEDYSRQIVFSSAFFILLGLFSGSVVASNLFPSWFFWLTTFGAFLGFSLGIFKYSLRFYEAFEAAFFAFLPWQVFYYLGRSLFLAGFLVFLILFFNYLNGHYKGFGWYKSGRIGLAGLLVAGLFFLVRSALAIVNPALLFLASQSEAVLSGISAFTIFLLVYNLAIESS